jgi:lysophospholipase L1-like esterase
MNGAAALRLIPLAALTVLASGCNSVSYTSHIVSTPQAQYRAYGDSITTGAGLSDPATESYPTLVAVFENVTFANNAIDGSEACDLAPSEIFPNLDSPTLSTHPTYTVLIGTNDVGVKVNIPTYHAIFSQCHQAALSWLAIPAEYKVLAGSAGMASSGPGMLDTTNNWNSWTTEGQGSSISFTISTSSPGPIYAWPRIDDNSAATYTYSLDGVVLGSAAVQTKPKIITRNGGNDSMTLLRFADVHAGKHVVTFTQTNTGTDGVSVVGIATPASAVGDRLPVVLAGIIPFEEDPSQGGRCGDSDPNCDAYIQLVEDDVALLAADGLDVRLFNTRKYMFGTPAEMADKSHPNALGHLEISHSVEAVW